MEKFSDRLRLVIGKRTAHEWAISHALPPQKIGDWLKNNRRPQAAQIALLEKTTGIPSEWWIHGKGHPPVAALATESVHEGQAVVDNAAKRELSDGPACFSEDWLLKNFGANQKNFFSMHMSGDSMEPTLRRGDMILVDCRITSPDVDGVYIVRINGVMLVKRLQILPGNLIRVSTDNPAFLSFEIRTNDERKAMTIVGRAIWFGRAL